MTIIYSIDSTETKTRVKVLCGCKKFFKGFGSCPKPCDSIIPLEEGKTAVLK